MIAYIIMIISLLLDGILSNFIPYSAKLSLFYPMFTVMSIIIIYPLYKKDDKKYLMTIFILGIIYDLLYTNLLIFNGVIFIIMGLLIKYIYKNIPTNYLTILLYAFIGVLIYDSLSSIIFIIFNLVAININDIIYKIAHSLLLNLLYLEILYIIIRLIPKKYTKIKYN